MRNIEKMAQHAFKNIDVNVLKFKVCLTKHLYT